MVVEVKCQKETHQNTDQYITIQSHLILHPFLIRTKQKQVEKSHMSTHQTTAGCLTLQLNLI